MDRNFKRVDFKIKFSIFLKSRLKNDKRTFRAEFLKWIVKKTCEIARINWLNTMVIYNFETVLYTIVQLESLHLLNTITLYNYSNRVNCIVLYLRQPWLVWVSHLRHFLELFLLKISQTDRVLARQNLCKLTFKFFFSLSWPTPWTKKLHLFILTCWKLQKVV